MSMSQEMGLKENVIELKFRSIFIYVLTLISLILLVKHGSNESLKVSEIQKVKPVT
jgi:hypothetical protein